MMISRRMFLAGTSALAIVPALPTLALPTAAAAPIETVKTATTIWVGGTDGEFDWRPFNAATKKDALKQLANYHGWEYDLEGDPYLPTGLSLQRAPKMDGLLPDEIKPHHWIRSGLGAFCDRCDSECYGNDTGRVFGTEVVCEECTTIPDLLSGDEYDVQMAEERLTEWFLDHDCDEASVREQMSRDFDLNLIPVDIWQKCLAEARAEL